MWLLLAFPSALLLGLYDVAKKQAWRDNAVLPIGVSDRTGTLQRGKDADIVILDRKLNVRAVWSMGNLVPETITLV